MNLFREEAVKAAASTSNMGEIRLRSPRLARYVATFSAAFCVITIAVVCLGSYTRREKVTGTLMPVNGLVEIHSDTHGVISGVRVHLGQRVTKGEVLAVVSGSTATSAFGLTSEKLEQNTRADISRLQDQIKEASLAAKRTIEAIEQEHEQDVAGLQAIRSQVTSAEAIEANLDQVVKRMKPLAERGYVSLIDELKAENDVKSALGQVLQLKKSETSARSQIEDDVQKVRDAKYAMSTKISDLNGQLSLLSSSLVNNEVVSRGLVLAPNDGVISRSTAVNGQQVDTGQVIFSLVPSGSPLEAVLLVPSSSIGFVREGLTVSLRYSAFPFEKFGAQIGHVSRVSRSTISPEAYASTFGGIPPDSPMYLVYVTLPSQAISVYGSPVTLTSGSSLDADILLDRRKIIEWIFEPIYAYGASDS